MLFRRREAGGVLEDRFVLMQSKLGLASRTEIVSVQILQLASVTALATSIFLDRRHRFSLSQAYNCATFAGAKGDDEGAKPHDERAPTGRFRCRRSPLGHVARDQFFELNDVSREFADPFGGLFGRHGVLVEHQTEGLFITGDLLDVHCSRD